MIMKEFEKAIENKKEELKQAGKTISKVKFDLNRADFYYRNGRKAAVIFNR